jgi:hypothetical protein
MSKVLQMRIKDSEWAVITLGAKQRQLTMTGLIKEALYFYLSHAPQLALPERDRFEALLEDLEKGPKVSLPESERMKFDEVRSSVASGKAKGLGKSEALALIKKAANSAPKTK